MSSVRPPRTRRAKRAIIDALESRFLLAIVGMVKDINPGTPNAFFDLHHATTFGDVLYFGADDGTGGNEPYISFGSTLLTGLTADLNPGGGSNPEYFTAGTVNGAQAMFFTATPFSNVEVFQVVNNQLPLQRTTFAGAVTPAHLHFIGTHLVFMDQSEEGIWSLGPTGAAQKLSDVNGFAFMGDLAGFAYFHATDAQDHWGLYKTDGLSVSLVKDFGNGSVEDEGAVFGGSIFFQAHDGPDSGFHLWKSNGITTTQVDHVNDSGNGMNPHHYVIDNGFLYFIANDGSPTDEVQIWRSDGNEPTKLTHMTTGSSSIDDLINFEGTLYFTYRVPTESTRLLYKLVGTTPTLVGTTSGGIDGGTEPDYLTVAAGGLYFTAKDKNNITLLFTTNGKDIFAVDGDTGAYPRTLIGTPNVLYYASQEDEHGTELHIIDNRGDSEKLSARLKVDFKSVNEGGTVNFNCVTEGPTGAKWYYWDFDGDGTLDGRQGPKPFHLYRDNLPNDAVRRVRVKVLERESGEVVNAYINITVHNVAPVFKKVIIPTTYVFSYPMPFTFVVYDPGLDDRPKVTTNWGGEVYDVRFGIVHSTQTFAGFSLFGKTIESLVTVADKDLASSSVRRNLNLQLAVHTDATMEGLGVAPGLVIGGSQDNDRVRIVNNTGIIDVLFGGVTRSSINLAPTDVISVYLGAGNDRLECSGNLVNSVVAEGGDGNDTLGGGLLHDFLRGGLGVDKFLRTDGKDRLVN